MSNKTSDKNVAKVEEDVKRCNELTKVEHANWIGISNQLAISHILAEREQDKKRIQELEIKLKCAKDLYDDCCKCLLNSIPKQVVINRMKELKDRLKNNKNDLNKNPDPINSKFNSFDDYFEWKHKILEENKLIKLRIKDLQELLEGGK